MIRPRPLLAAAGLALALAAGFSVAAIPVLAQAQTKQDDAKKKAAEKKAMAGDKKAAAAEKKAAAKDKGKKLGADKGEKKGLKKAQ